MSGRSRAAASSRPKPAGTIALELRVNGVTRRAVLMNGDSVCACLVPAAQAHGATIVTVEGLARGATLSALQQAFVEHGAAQCGICTPGMLITSVELLGRVKGRVPAEAEVREALAGNLCRCTGYQRIVDAVRAAARRQAAPRRAAARRQARPKERPRARRATAKRGRR
jgi:aerobic-type carbon monoxide dehydrogenase small subunit (CoxS/CutS family)